MRLLLFFGLLLFSSAANAEWLQSSSAHFVVYANDSERNLRSFSQQLERYDSAMAALTGIKNPPPSPSNRVTVFVVKDADEVREIIDRKGSTIAGAYSARAGGSIAIIPRVSAASSGELDQSMQIMLHEYAHHFIISQGGFPLPRWLSEGAAEFFAQAIFNTDGSVGLGRPANLRVIEFQNLETLGRDLVSVEEMVDPAAYDRRKNKTGDAFYPKSWALYHYLMLGGGRKGQLTRYTNLMMQGKKSPEAAREAFGDLNALDREVMAYLGKGRMTAIKMPADMLQAGAVQMRKLSAGEAEMMPVFVRSRAGVNKERALALVIQARAIAARHPADAAVQSALAEAEYDAGNDAEAVAAAGNALRIDAGRISAFEQFGLARLRMAEKATGTEKAALFDNARQAFLNINRLEVENPVALIQFFQSFARQGVPAPKEALQGLAIAAKLAPFDLGLRYNLAMQQIRTKQLDEARGNLLPVAYNPHNSALANRALQALARLEADPAWDGGGSREATDSQEQGQGAQAP